jgi:hypothetical protein
MLLLIVTTLAAWWFLRTPREETSLRADRASAKHFSGGTVSPAPSKFVATPGNSRAAQSLPGGELVIADIAAATRALNAPDSTVEKDLELLQSVIDFYRRANSGSNPGGGLNEEIVDQLRGKNAKRLAVIPPNHASINAQGQLLDRWGTPFWFHPIARDALDIRSAGPDRKLWTSDDVEVSTGSESSAAGLGKH